MSDIISSELNADEKNSWSTPQWLFDAINSMFYLELDVASSIINRKCAKFYDLDDDALSKDWSNDCPPPQSAWCNPPYSRGMIKKFIDKAQEQREKGVTTVMLVPATPDAFWFPENASEVWMITNGRISFVNPVTNKAISGNTKGSMILVFKPHHFQTVTRFIKREQLKAIGEAA